VKEPRQFDIVYVLNNDVLDTSIGYTINWVRGHRVGYAWRSKENTERDIPKFEMRVVNAKELRAMGPGKWEQFRDPEEAPRYTYRVTVTLSIGRFKQTFHNCTSDGQAINKMLGYIIKTAGLDFDRVVASINKQVRSAPDLKVLKVD
jgi:hypothetical protein